MTSPAVIAVIASLAVGVTACRASLERPALRATTSSDDAAEIRVGKLLESLAHGFAARYEDAKLARYVETVGQRIAARSERPRLPWRFIVLDSPVPAAYAMPGGVVVVSRGALAYLNSEAELAAVLAHEVAHVAWRHSAVAWHPELPVAREDREAFERRISRADDCERQADAVAVRYLEAAGYDPRALGWALQALERSLAHESDVDVSGRRPSVEPADATGVTEDEHDPHPPLPARMARIAAVSTRQGGEVAQSRYLEELRGLELGAGRYAVRVSGGRFVVPGELSFELPRGFRGELGCGVASFSDGAAQSTELSVIYVRSPHWREILTSAFKAHPYTVSELAGQRVITAALRPHGSTGTAALIEARSSAVIVAVQGESPAPDARLRALLATLRREKQIPLPARTIRIETARRSQRFEQFLAERCQSTAPAEAFALNGLTPTARVSRGKLLKCVEVHGRVPGGSGST